jgi:hypothetical protein
MPFPGGTPLCVLRFLRGKSVSGNGFFVGRRLLFEAKYANWRKIKITRARYSNNIRSGQFACL